MGVDYSDGVLEPVPCLLHPMAETGRGLGWVIHSNSPAGSGPRGGS